MLVTISRARRAYRTTSSARVEGVLGSLAVVFPLDPDDYREPELLPCGPALLVEHVGLKKRSEALHGRLVSRGADAAHRSGHVVTAQLAGYHPAPKWLPLSACRMHPETSPRRATALRTVSTASFAVIRSEIE